MLEGDGFELPVRGRGKSGCRPSTPASEAGWRDIEPAKSPAELGRSGVSPSRRQVTLLPTIHELTHAMQLLLIAESGQTPRRDDPTVAGLMILGEIVAHRSVVQSLTQLCALPYMKPPYRWERLADYIQNFANRYRTLVEPFIPDFETVLVDSESQIVEVDPAIKYARPQFIYMISECIASLSSVVSDPMRKIICQPEPDTSFPERDYASLR
jgi:hypothetical protein